MSTPETKALQSSRVEHLKLRRGILDRRVSAEAALAVALCILLGSRVGPLPFTPYAGLIGLILVPALLALARFRGLTVLSVLLGLAVVSGVILTLASTTHTALPSVMVGRSAMIIAFIGSLAVVAYARTVIGVPATAIAYGVGMLLAAVATGPSAAGAWRFTYSIPVAVLILGILAIRPTLVPQLLGLLVLAAIGFANDSRSNSAMLVLAAVILLWQRFAHAVSPGRRRAGNVLGVLIFGAGVFQLIQFSLLEGFFGAATQEKTSAQIELTGSLLLGGRPEAAASFALVNVYPFGLGTGLRATASDISAAKSSMLAIGYNPENNYVEQFMFGGGTEVHSVIGDFWLWFGLAGLAACAAMIVVIVRGLEFALANAALTGLLAYLTIRAFWDLAFSPPAPSMTTLALLIPLIAVMTPHAKPKSAAAVRSLPRSERRPEHAYGNR